MVHLCVVAHVLARAQYAGIDVEILARIITLHDHQWLPRLVCHDDSIIQLHKLLGDVVLSVFLDLLREQLPIRDGLQLQPVLSTLDQHQSPSQEVLLPLLMSKKG